MNEKEFERKLLKWLKKIARQESLPEGIVSLNIGIFENANDHYSMYLIGSIHDIKEIDWACYEDFVPNEKYLHIKDKELSSLKWEDFLELVRGTLPKVLSDPSLENSLFSTVQHITTGFDGGDLYEVK